MERTSEEEYKPTDKPAPEPAVSAPGLDSASDALPTVSDTPRKLRHKAPVANAAKALSGAVDSAKKTVDRVKDFVSPPTQRKLTESELVKAVREKDARRLKGVKRYSRQTKGVFAPLIRAMFIELGVKNVSSADIDAVYASLKAIKSTVGYRVTKSGELKARALPVTDSLSYILGSTALDVEEWSARQWINHPTLFDTAVLVGVGLSVYQNLSMEDSSFKVALKNAVEKHQADKGEPIKAEAKVSDPDNG